ncbi:hypothetical protein GDO86_017027 [Hymenochirus boettgeri]|uniref:Uncharacterized protein n=1 Tax=Hymenochirus boettgeri TaxID=247094 RepID=A0A8T2IKX3_9PIPI|nr:hypothetical protein GDO86_017027 [Hymenochirus boettgeri]
MVTRRTRLMSDIEQSFQEVYQSLVIDRSLDGSFQQRRNNYRVFSRSESCLTLHKCSGTSTKVREEKKNVNLKDSTLISKKHHCVEAFESSERRNSSYPDCTLTPKQRQKTEPELFRSNSDEKKQDSSLPLLLLDDDNIVSEQTSFNEQESFSFQSTSNEINECYEDDLYKVKETTDKQILCESCCKLHRKAIKHKTASIKKPKILDPNHWCCDFWMMVYRTPLVVNVSRRKRRLRDILKVLERCGWKRTVVTCGKCSRAHPFLQRNLRACKNAQKAFFKYRQKRSQIKGGSSACKSNANLQKMRTSQNSEKVKKPFVFVIDSSQEEDADLILKEQKRKTDTKRRSLNKSKLVCNLSSPHSQKQDYNRSEKTALVRHTQLNSCNLSKNSPSEFFIEESEDSECSNIVRSETTPQESSESFTWVNCGSFRQMLAKLNSGCLRSAAIKEH